MRATIMDDVPYIAIPDLCSGLTQYADQINTEHPIATAYLRLVVGQLLDYALQAHQAEDATG